MKRGGAYAILDRRPPTPSFVCRARAHDQMLERHQEVPPTARGRRRPPIGRGRQPGRGSYFADGRPTRAASQTDRLAVAERRRAGRQAVSVGRRPGVRRGGQRRGAVRRAQPSARGARPHLRGHRRRRREPRRDVSRGSRAWRRGRPRSSWSSSGGTSARPRRWRPASTMRAGDVIVPMDGDLQNDPADIALLLEKIDEGYDVVSGWRRDRQDSVRAPAALADRELADRPRHRRAPARLRLHAEGVPRRDRARDPALRRDAPLPPGARLPGGRADHRDPRAPPPARRAAAASTASAARSRCCSTCSR